MSEAPTHSIFPSRFSCTSLLHNMVRCMYDATGSRQPIRLSYHHTYVTCSQVPKCEAQKKCMNKSPTALQCTFLPFRTSIFLNEVRDEERETKKREKRKKIAGGAFVTLVNANITSHHAANAFESQITWSFID